MSSRLWWRLHRGGSVAGASSPLRRQPWRDHHHHLGRLAPRPLQLAVIPKTRAVQPDIERVASRAALGTQYQPISAAAICAYGTMRDARQSRHTSSLILTWGRRQHYALPVQWLKPPAGRLGRAGPAPVLPQRNAAATVFADHCPRVLSRSGFQHLYWARLLQPLQQGEDHCRAGQTGHGEGGTSNEVTPIPKQCWQPCCCMQSGRCKSSKPGCCRRRQAICCSNTAASTASTAGAGIDLRRGAGTG